MFSITDQNTLKGESSVEWWLQNVKVHMYSQLTIYTHMHGYMYLHVRCFTFLQYRSNVILHSTILYTQSNTTVQHDTL